MNIKFGNQICDSDMYRRIISFQIAQNRTIQIRKFTGAQKSLKLVPKDQRK